MTDSEIVELVESCPEWTGRPVTTATEISEKMGISRWGAQKRLNNLVEREEISRYKPGRSVVYWKD